MANFRVFDNQLPPLSMAEKTGSVRKFALTFCICNGLEMVSEPQNHIETIAILWFQTILHLRSTGKNNPFTSYGKKTWG